jgi:hypothetical protein
MTAERTALQANAEPSADHAAARLAFDSPWPRGAICGRRYVRAPPPRKTHQRTSLSQGAVVLAGVSIPTEGDRSLTQNPPPGTPRNGLWPRPQYPPAKFSLPRLRRGAGFAFHAEFSIRPDTGGCRNCRCTRRSVFRPWPRARGLYREGGPFSVPLSLYRTGNTETPNRKEPRSQPGNL